MIVLSFSYHRYNDYDVGPLFVAVRPHVRGQGLCCVGVQIGECVREVLVSSLKFCDNKCAHKYFS